MNTAPTTRLLRKPAVLDTAGFKSTKLDSDVKAGRWPPPIKLSRRWVGWPEDECLAVVRARIAGDDDEQIKALVKRLVEARQFKRTAA